MAKIHVAINGFGRIGRNTLKAAYDHFKMKNIELVAVNDLMDTESLAQLLKYDSVYGKWGHKISYDKKHLIIDGKKILAFQEREPANLPWKKLKVDVVLECTGFFTKTELASLHLKAGAKKVIVSAPVKDGAPTFLLGVNAKKYKNEKVINMGSCTTNCVAPASQIIENAFGVKKALMTTVHAVTAAQNLVDGAPKSSKKDYRRARSALVNIVPTTTGAAVATTEAIPKLKGIFDGLAVRVPVSTGSLSDFTFLLKKKTTVEKVKKVFKKAAKTSHKGIIEASEDPLVSTDIIGNPHSSIVDLGMIKVVDGDLLKIMAWYDNEWGYSCRLIEFAEI
ncbi:MAG: type I glyceraldehyde-3-phosphate dehydrogenase, partial [Patescibacteria group bacterium]|nr:type I glyceraldehyde-3-phosphate dehydrogenase [Patescibacteria group bacterium]